MRLPVHPATIGAVVMLTGLGLALAGGATLAQQQQQTGEDAALPQGFETTPVLRTGATRDGEPIAYPQTDRPEIVSVIGTIEPGGRTPLHEHPVPTYVYILEGEVELQTAGGEPHRYKAGEAYIEALNSKHQLFNNRDAPAKVLVVFVGDEGQPTTIAAQ